MDVRWRKSRKERGIGDEEYQSWESCFYPKAFALVFVETVTLRGFVMQNEVREDTKKIEVVKEKASNPNSLFWLNNGASMERHNTHAYNFRSQNSRRVISQGQKWMAASGYMLNLSSLKTRPSLDVFQDNPQIKGLVIFRGGQFSNVLNLSLFLSPCVHSCFLITFPIITCI